MHTLPFVYMPIRAVTAAVGFSVSRIYALIKLGEFPPGDLIGGQSRRWKSTDIAAWLLAQAEKAEVRNDELAAPLKRKAEAASRRSVEKRLEDRAALAGAQS